METLTSSVDQTWILRLPKGIGAGAEPYEPQLYKETEGPVQEAEDAELKKPQERRRRALERMHDVANTIRWKWVDGSGGVPVSPGRQVLGSALIRGSRK